MSKLVCLLKVLSQLLVVSLSIAILRCLKLVGIWNFGTVQRLRAVICPYPGLLQGFEGCYTNAPTLHCSLQVESLCQSDPEGLALRLAGKGAVSAALDVAETFKLSSDLRRELQGRQLVKLLTTDPINGGGPAGGLRFLNSLLQPEDALPVAMAAMEQLPNLQSKQLLVIPRCLGGYNAEKSL